MTSKDANLPYIMPPPKAQHIRHDAEVAEKSKFAAEFLGTFMLVFTVCLNDTTMEIETPLSAALGIFGPLSIGCVLMVLIYALGGISGAHLNPAVTVANYLQETISMKEATIYMGVQCAAGVLAGLSTLLLDGYADTSKGNRVGPNPEINAELGAPLVEFIYTFMLCFVVLNVAAAEETKGNNFYGVAIGLVIVAGGYGGGYVSGGAFNPAVVLGVNFMGFNPSNPYLNFFYVPIYIGVQLLAGIVAPTAMHIVRPSTKLKETHTYAITQALYKVEAFFDPDDTSEFIGAFFIALGVTLNGLAAQHARSHGHGGNPGAALSVGATLMCMIFAMGDISGGLFNPAVTLAYLGRFHGTGCGVPNKAPDNEKDQKIQDLKRSPKEAVKYLLCQVLGAVAGMGLTILIWLASGSYPIAPVGPQPTGVGHGNHTIGQAFFAETFGTFLFCYVVICVSVTFKPLKEFKAYAIGSAYIAGGYAFGPLSGGILNPAITLGTCLVNFSVLTDPKVPLLFVLAEALGGVLSVVVFRFVTHPHEYDEKLDLQSAEGYTKLPVKASSSTLLPLLA